jgi:hypothetical protein
MVETLLFGECIMSCLQKNVENRIFQGTSRQDGNDAKICIKVEINAAYNKHNVTHIVKA